MKKLVKKFPLTSYSVVAVLITSFLAKNANSDDPVGIINFLILLFLGAPLTAVNQLLITFGINNTMLLFWLFPIFSFLLLDLLLFHLTPKLITKIRSKPNSSNPEKSGSQK